MHSGVGIMALVYFNRTAGLLGSQDSAAIGASCCHMAGNEAKLLSA